MKRTILTLLTAFALTATYLPAQGRGGGQRGGGGGGMQGGGQSPAMGQSRQGGQIGSQAGKGTMQRDQIRATDQQRDQLRTCDQASAQLRTRARDMAKSASGPNFNADQARQQRDQIREQLQTMQQDHERLMNGLSAEQKETLQNRIQNMDQLRERVNTRLQQVDAELDQEVPNSKMVRDHARDMEKATKEWQKQYRKMQGELGV